MNFIARQTPINYTSSLRFSLFAVRACLWQLEKSVGEVATPATFARSFVCRCGIQSWEITEALRIGFLCSVWIAGVVVVAAAAVVVVTPVECEHTHTNLHGRDIGAELTAAHTGEPSGTTD